MSTSSIILGLNRSREETACGNVVIAARTRRYRDVGFRTPFSLKAVRAGRALYRTDDGVHLVEPGDLLVLPTGQRYDLTITSPTETAALFIAPPDLPAGAVLAAGRYDGRGFAGRLVLALARRARSGDDSTALRRDCFDQALRDLVTEQRRAASRLDTRNDRTAFVLLARLRLARDLLHARFAWPLAVDDAARVACLSPSHLHRSFRLAFGVTPMRLVEARRFDEALRLLRETDRPVGEVARRVGYASTGTFTTRFRRRTGRPPAAWRRAFRPSGHRSGSPGSTRES